MNYDAFVFILFGQSNAVGHNLPMKEQDKIKTPLKNVFGLKRSKNQSFDIEKIQWDNYISAEMNLAEEQDDTYSIANCIAVHWQNAIDEGKSLPDLYIVHIAIGAQGVTEKFMWNPDREKNLVPGKLGTVNISLHSFSMHILTLVSKFMKEAGKNPYFLLHWRGGEQEMNIPKSILKTQLQNIYERMFNDYLSVLKENFFVKLHRIIAYKCAKKSCADESFSRSLDFINETFEELTKKYSFISVFDPKNAPSYSENDEHYGVFAEDDVHFTQEVNDWIASVILNEAEKL